MGKNEVLKNLKEKLEKLENSNIKTAIKEDIKVKGADYVKK